MADQSLNDPNAILNAAFNNYEKPQEPASPEFKPNRLSLFLTGLGAGIQGKDATGALQANLGNQEANYERAKKQSAADRNKAAQAKVIKDLLPSILPNFPVNKYANATDDEWVAAGEHVPKLIETMNKMSDSLTKTGALAEETRHNKAGEALEGQKIKQMGEIKKSAAADKESFNQDKAYSEMRTRMESFRGNLGVQQASVAVGNADRALAIVKSIAPDDLTLQDLRLFADEMAKVATGGVPTEHGTTDLLPANARLELKKLQNFISSKPTKAQMGEYVNHNLVYLNDMKDSAGQKIKDFRSNIAKGYKDRVKPEQYQEALDDYGIGATSAPQQPAQPSSAAAPAANTIQTFSGFKLKVQ